MGKAGRPESLGEIGEPREKIKLLKKLLKRPTISTSEWREIDKLYKEANPEDPSLKMASNQDEKLRQAVIKEYKEYNS